MKKYKIAVAGTGYVGLSIATLLSQHHKVVAVDIVPEKIEMINNRKSPIQDDYIEKYLAEKDLDLTATLDAKAAYSDAVSYTHLDVYKRQVLDRDMTGEDIEGVPVVANAENVAEFLRQSWVDEVFINLDESIPYPKELIERCSEMGLTVHLNLVKITNSTLGKQSIGKVGEYTVLTTSINYMTMRQAFLKRTMDIAAGLAGCIATGIIFVFVAPIIYISSPGPIFFSQERVGPVSYTHLPEEVAKLRGKSVDEILA